MEINCFKETYLENKFEDLIKNIVDEEEQRNIGVSLILQEYKQLQEDLNSLRKSCGLSVISLKVITPLSDIKDKYNNLISKLELKIIEDKKKSEEDLLNKKNITSNKVSTNQDLEKIKISIGEKEFEIEVAYTDEQKEKGLSNRETLKENSGMLFVWEKPEEVSIWMKDTLIPLDIIFIDEELNVKSVYTGTPNSEEMITEQNVSFVLELNPNSGIEVGDEIEFSPNKQGRSDRMTSLNEDGSLRSKENDDGKMSVLNENGDVQMLLEGGERIFSRANTKILIKFAKKASATKKDSDYKALGKRVFKFLNEQDKNDPEYVTKK